MVDCWAVRRRDNRKEDKNPMAEECKTYKEESD